MLLQKAVPEETFTACFTTVLEVFFSIMYLHMTFQTVIRLKGFPTKVTHKGLLITVDDLEMPPHVSKCGEGDVTYWTLIAFVWVCGTTGVGRVFLLVNEHGEFSAEGLITLATLIHRLLHLHRLWLLHLLVVLHQVTQ